MFTLKRFIPVSTDAAALGRAIVEYLISLEGLDSLNITTGNNIKTLGLMQTKLTQTAVTNIVSADYGVVVPDHYTIPSGYTLTIESGAVMAIA